MSLKATTQSSTVHAIIDVSKVEKTKKGQKTLIDIPSDITDLKLQLKFYPLGDGKATNNHVSCYLSISKRFGSELSHDTRVVAASITCGDQKIPLDSQPIGRYSPGLGRSNFFRIALVESNSVIDIDIYIKQQQLSHPLECDKKKKLRSLYDLCKKHGNVKLIPVSISSEKVQNAEACAENDDAKRGGIDEEDESQCARISSLLLMNASQVFANMLNNEMKEKQEKCIAIPCESVQVIDDMVYFIITGEFRATASVFDLVKLAHCYQMTDLLLACLERMVENVTAKDFVAVVNVFEKYNLVNDKNVDYIYGKLLYHFHQNKATLLKAMENHNELPFCFRHLIDFMDVGLFAFQRLESAPNDE